MENSFSENQALSPRLSLGNYIPVYTVYLETDGNRNESLANV